MNTHIEANQIFCSGANELLNRNATFSIETRLGEGEVRRFFRKVEGVGETILRFLEVTTTNVIILLDIFHHLHAESKLERLNPTIEHPH